MRVLTGFFTRATLAQRPGSPRRQLPAQSSDPQRDALVECAGANSVLEAAS